MGIPYGSLLERAAGRNKLILRSESKSIRSESFWIRGKGYNESEEE
jgi:hypothetical protein